MLNTGRKVSESIEFGLKSPGDLSLFFRGKKAVLDLVHADLESADAR
jgi:hypothetical protein